MSFFYEPVNLSTWNMFEKVSAPGHVETFLATSAMKPGDMVLLYVGNQNPKYKSGIYAVGEVLTEPYIVKCDPDDYCNNKKSVDVKITKIDYANPFIEGADCKDFIKPYQSVHKIKTEYEGYIASRIEK